MSLFTPHEREVVSQAFDAAWYVERYPDIGELGVDPLDHFMESGWREGRDPNAEFSIRDYLDLNHDIADLGINPFLHWLSSGRTEGRETRIELGFRYDILRDALSLEERLELSRRTPLPGDPEIDLFDAFESLAGEKLFITVSHDNYIDSVGGIQACLQAEAAALAASDWAHVHLYPADPIYVTNFEASWPMLGLIVDGRAAGVWRADHVAAHAAMFAHRRGVRRTGFAVHSLLGHNVSSVIGILQNAGARQGFFWLHDQSSLCTSYVLLRNDVAYCGGPAPESAACGVCLYGRRRPIQLAEHASFFRAFDVTAVAPSQAMLDHWLARAPFETSRTLVHPHLSVSERGAARVSDGPLRVAFLGFPYPHKGWPIFRDLAERFGGDGIEFFHFSTKEDPDAPVMRVDVAPDGSGRNVMAEAVADHDIDVAMILSICPETFSFTAHEAFAGGAAVVAFRDSCAVAELVDQRRLGVVIDSEDELRSLFTSGRIHELARARRTPMLYDLTLSRMTADLLERPR